MAADATPRNRKFPIGKKRTTHPLPLCAGSLSVVFGFKSVKDLIARNAATTRESSSNRRLHGLQLQLRLLLLILE
jgi:hypothetical protein